MKHTFPDKQRLLSKLHRTLRLLPHFPKPLPQPTLGAGSESLLQIGFPETSSVVRTQTETSSFRPQQFARWTDPADIWADPAPMHCCSPCWLGGRQEMQQSTESQTPILGQINKYFGTHSVHSHPIPTTIDNCWQKAFKTTKQLQITTAIENSACGCNQKLCTNKLAIINQNSK